jgi:hypothetical protein
MSERRDDTPEADEPSRIEGERPRGSYYYDDSTGYEIYDPNADTDEDEKDESDFDSEAENSSGADAV